MKFDREAISDIEPDSILLAGEVRRQANIGFNSIPLRKIAPELGIFKISEKPLKNIEGALVVPEGKFEGEILLNSSTDPGRKRFTLAHEIGHFLHPLHHPESDFGRFECDNTDIFNTFNRTALNGIEAQANDFASEILTPTKFVKQAFKDIEHVNMGSLIDFCAILNVSKAAAFRKIHDICCFPVAFIFSHNGVIRYLHCDDFPRLKVWYKNALSVNSISRLFSASDNTFSKPQIADPGIWLSTHQQKTLIEQVLIQEDGYRITVLTLK